MSRIFRQLPLSAKLILIGLVPFLFIVYLSYTIYVERTTNSNLLSNYIKRVEDASKINHLIEELQKERRISFLYSKTKEGKLSLGQQRASTDSALNEVKKIDALELKEFPTYTFVENLDSTRRLVDQQGPWVDDIVMYYYSNTIYRLNSLNPLSPQSDPTVQIVYNDLEGQKALSQMITFMGVIRANIYNLLFTKQEPSGTIYGTRGVYDIYKSYEREFLVKAPDSAVNAYKNLEQQPEMQQFNYFLEKVFRDITVDGPYNADSWWEASGGWVNQLFQIENDLQQNVTVKFNELYRKERAKRIQTLIFLIISALIIAAIVIYTIHIINKKLKALKNSARAISIGSRSAQPVIYSRDVIGDLAKSIADIDRNNRQLAASAEAIGQGNFDYPLKPRSEFDILGQAIVKMKKNLQQFTRALAESKEQFQELAERYQTIFYNSPLPMLIYEESTLRFLEVNESAMSLYGYTQAEFLNMIYPAIQSGTEIDIPPSGAGEFMELEHKKKNGDIAVVELTSYPIEYNEKDARLVTVNDITERREAEVAIRSSEKALAEERNLLRSLIDNLPDYIYVKDRQSRYIISNKAFVRLAGLKTEAETYGKKVTDLFNKEIWNINEEEDRRVIEKGESIVDRDEPIISINGEHLWLLTTKIPLKDKDGQVIGILGISKDITERKKSEEALRSSEEKYRLLFEDNPMPLWMFSIKDLRFIDVNESASQHYGYTKEEFLNMSINDIRPPEDIEKVKSVVAHKSDGVRHSGVWNHMKKDGTRIKVEIISHDIEYENEQVRLVLAMDVTEKLRASEALKQSFEDIRELASHLENIREEERIHIAREIHDELGQQLTVLKMDISWLNKKLSDSDDMIKKKIAGVLQLLDNTVKTVRRISSELRPSMLDDLGLVPALEWQSQEFERRTGIASKFVAVMPEMELGQRLSTTIFRIYQESLTNIARHAEASEVVATLKNENSHLILTIIDNGKGFVISDIENKKTLGILGMKERAAMMGGSCAIQSTPGRGTTIIFKVPLSSDN